MIKENKKMAYMFMLLSFSASILYSYLLSFTERGLPLFDWFNLGLIIFWLSILLWVAWDIHKDKASAKGTLLFITCIVGLLTGIDFIEEDDFLPIAAVSVIETLFLFSAYLFSPKIKKVTDA
ncbi:MAG: hypothetical protein HND53_12295 [Proteobacteria bacterium]|nr:hypothetical protein [Pseudomonadota bacterium]NOG61274.1 hypothetical protein [Pseudomonadota bacterium]